MASLLSHSALAAAGTPKARQRFDGLDRRQASQGDLSSLAPDTSIAAGGGFVLEAVNSALRLSGEDGTNSQILGLNDFFGQSETPDLFQPTVFFDRMRSRFYVAALSFDRGAKTSFLHFAVSGSLAFGLSPNLSDAAWCKFRYNVRRGASYAGSLNLGVNEFWVAATTDDYKFKRDRFQGASLYLIDKELFGAGDEEGNCIVPKLAKRRLSKRRDRSPARAVQPALHYTGNDLGGRPLFLVATDTSSEASDLYTLWRIERSRQGEPEVERVELKGQAPYARPPDAPQRGAFELDTGDARVTQAAFRSGRIWLAHTTGCELGPPPTESCIKVVEITPTDDGAEISFEQTIGKKNWFYWMPGVATNLWGDALVAFHRSRQKSNFGLAFSHKSADRSRFGKARKLHNGKCGLVNLDEDGNNRTGGLVAVQADPEDDLGFWVAGEYPAQVPDLGCDWRTRIVLLRGAPVVGGAPIELASGSLTVAGAAQRSRHTVTTQISGVAESAGRLLVVALRGADQAPDACSGCATLDYAFLAEEIGWGPRLDVELESGPRSYFVSLGYDLAVAHQPTPG